MTGTKHAGSQTSWRIKEIRAGTWMDHHSKDRDLSLKVQPGFSAVRLVPYLVTGSLRLLLINTAADVSGTLGVHSFWCNGNNLSFLW